MLLNCIYRFLQLQKLERERALLLRLQNFTSQNNYTTINKYTINETHQSATQIRSSFSAATVGFALVSCSRPRAL
jgi:hypothetical protein